jgi:DNA (cytosine-5)-methyltransferase 3A|tara:strand:+ start:366 stop:1445 length:1080 start_codon:yes stop_codon:yes gene_type:complete
MNVLSLFDGMSCGQLALQQAGIKVDNYYACELDKYAIQVAQKNFPDTIQLGDVSEFSEDYLKAHNNFDDPPIDLLMGGSPCQGFSVAGKQLDFDDPRSKLFFEFVRIKDELQPKYFLMENVPMKQECQDIISKYLGVQPVTINSSLFSAQNRKRLYWTNIPFDIPTEDKGIVLQDILEDGIANDVMTNKEGKSHCITARYNGAVWWNSIQRKQRTMVQVGEADNIKGFDSIKRIYSPSGKAPTLTTMQGGHREPKVAIGRIVNRRLDANGVRKDNQLELPLSTQLEISDSDKSNCLTTVNKDNVVVEGMQWRKLTPLECERLQTVPDNYTNHVSNSQRYKMLGNGWTVDVIAHIMKGLK